jgi:hypothetical protein
MRPSMAWIRRRAGSAGVGRTALAKAMILSKSSCFGEAETPPSRRYLNGDGPVRQANPAGTRVTDARLSASPTCGWNGRAGAAPVSGA